MGGSSILHAVGVKVRVVGTGNLIPTWFGFNNIRTKELVPIAMNATDAKVRARLGSFNSQGIKIKFETRVINEVFKINDIIPFVKPIATEYPNVD